jgi:hypothetical protein
MEAGCAGRTHQLGLVQDVDGREPGRSEDDLLDSVVLIDDVGDKRWLAEPGADLDETSSIRLRDVRSAHPVVTSPLR